MSIELLNRKMGIPLSWILSDKTYGKILSEFGPPERNLETSSCISQENFRIEKHRILLLNIPSR